MKTITVNRKYKLSAHGMDTLRVFKFWGGLIEFWTDSCCSSDMEYTLVLFGLIRIDLCVDFEREGAKPMQDLFLSESKDHIELMGGEL
jgi:hypothetical protein